MENQNAMTNGAYALLALIYERLTRENEASSHGESDYTGLLTLITATLDRPDVLQDIPVPDEDGYIEALLHVAVESATDGLAWRADCDAPLAWDLLAGGTAAMNAAMGRGRSE